MFFSATVHIRLWSPVTACLRPCSAPVPPDHPLHPEHHGQEGGGCEPEPGRLLSGHTLLPVPSE
jgi:hypothetical protein